MEAGKKRGGRKGGEGELDRRRTIKIKEGKSGKGRWKEPVRGKEDVKNKKKTRVAFSILTAIFFLFLLFPLRLLPFFLVFFLREAKI